MSQPQISVLLIVYKMRRQAMNTICSLSANYQRNVSVTDYEVLVVENESSEMLEESEVCALGDNIRYFRRTEPGVSPAPAINFGLAQINAPMLCLMIDGARMVTPRVIEYALQAQRASSTALAAVPGYNLGPTEHHFNLQQGYDADFEQSMLAQTNWQDYGYNLFNIASMGGAHLRGFFHPLMESNCLFCNTDVFREIGGADERFSESGGGSLNQHIYRALGIHPSGRYFFLMPGEGSFHQFHGGVSTVEREDRAELIRGFKAHLEEIWEGEYCALRREPIMLGAVTRPAQRFLQFSSRESRSRFDRFVRQGGSIWREDELFELNRHYDR